MNKGLILIGLGLLVVVIVLGSQYYQSSDTSEGYKPGDVVYMRVPSTGTIYKLVSEPAYVRYYLKNPVGDTVHVEDHVVTYKKSEILGWSFYDEHQVTIGAFPMEGLWTLEGKVFSTALGIIDVGDAFPTSKDFYVVEGTIIDNILAPIYLHGEHPLSIIFGTIDIIFPALIYPIMGVMLFIVFLVVNSHLRDARTMKLIKKHSK
jgi:hypothetical protein